MNDQTPLKVAAVQMVSQLSVDANLQRACELVTEAAGNGAEFVVLPENFACFANSHALSIARDEASEPHMVPTLKKLAADLGIYLCAGTLPLLPKEKDDTGKAQAASLMFDPQGQVLARYNKIHLFDAKVNDGVARYQESASFLAGKQPVNVQVADYNVGMSVCYDLRFSALYSHLRLKGAEILLVPSAFTAVTGEKHWMPLLQARAIEFQCYVIAANQGGIHDSRRETYGHSMIIDPEGSVISLLERGEGVIYGNVERSALDKVREAMPCFEHRRLF